MFHMECHALEWYASLDTGQLAIQPFLVLKVPIMQTPLDIAVIGE
ncbi:hypothetical protein [Alicyclobacillus ferrooxydans]|nr:hypothetical protein [Alicyclobacillus ferrooxydans]